MRRLDALQYLQLESSILKLWGGSRFHLLVWDDASGEMNWEEDDALEVFDSEETEVYSCNTKKDKDKRICRHSFGVLFGCWPCGVGMHNILLVSCFA